MNRGRGRCVVFFLGFIVALAIVARIHRRMSRRAETVHQDRYTFTSLPDDDQALMVWLKSQPGVSNVTIQRHDYDIDVSFVMNRTAIWPESNLQTEFMALGYNCPCSTSTSISSAAVTFH